MSFCAKHNQISKEHCKECIVDGYKDEIERLTKEVERLNKDINEHSLATATIISRAKSSSRRAAYNRTVWSLNND